MRAGNRAMAAMLVATAASGCAGTIRRYTYHPAADGAAPAWCGEAPVPMTVTTDDGLTLSGLFWAPRAPHRDILVYFHGNGGHLLGDATRAEPLAADGHGVLMTSYRGFSGNPGRPSEAGLARDAARLAAASGGRVRVVPLNGGDHHPDSVRIAPLIWRALEGGAS